MEVVLVVLLLIQTLILVGLLFGVSALLKRVTAIADDTEALLLKLDRVLETEAVPTLREARTALQAIYESAGTASRALEAVEPLAGVVGTYARGIRTGGSTVWLDGMRFLWGILKLYRSRKRRKSQKDPEESQGTVNQKEDKKDVE